MIFPVGTILLEIMLNLSFSCISYLISCRVTMMLWMITVHRRIRMDEYKRDYRCDIIYNITPPTSMSLIKSVEVPESLPCLYMHMTIRSI